MNVQPASIYEAVYQAGVTGLVGTVALGLLDNQGAYIDVLSTAGIIETPAGSGVYAATRTSPDAEGQYTLLWSVDGTTSPEQVAIDDLIVTGSAPGDPVPPADSYAGSDELFRRLKIRTPTAEQTAAAERILLAAAGEINQIMARTSDLAAWELLYLEEVNLQRAEELWNQGEVPFGAIGLDNPAGPVFLPRRSAALAKLTVVRQQWGVA